MVDKGLQEEDFELSAVEFFRRDGDEFWFDVQVRPNEASYHVKLSREEARQLWTELGEALGEEKR